MKIEHFNLESLTEMGSFFFKFVGNAIGGGEWWAVQLGERTLFHLHTTGSNEIENIYAKQKNYPYYCPTEKDHFFFFEDRLFHVTPALVDPLAEMVILYFARMTKKVKPEIKKIQREFGQSLVKFDKLLKEKAELTRNRTVPTTAATIEKPPHIVTAVNTPPPSVVEPEIPSSQPVKEEAGAKGDRDLQRERMRERRRRLGLPDEMP